MPRLVTKFKFMKSGKGKSAGGYAKYIATREGVEKIDDSHKNDPVTQAQQQLIQRLLRDFPDAKQTHEYKDFLHNPTKGNATEFISRTIEENMEAVADTKTYADYIATRPRAERFGSHGLFTDEGEPVHLSKVSEELNSYTGNVYTMIVSLRREDAERLGFNSGARWRDLMRGHTDVLAENLKIPMDHLRWYAAYHDEGHHPHIHLIAYSSVPGEGYLSKQGVEKIRSTLANDIYSQKLLCTYQQQTAYRDELRQTGRVRMMEIVEDINKGAYNNQTVQELLVSLADALSRTSGKKVYGYLRADVRAIVDRIVVELAREPRIQKLYDLWYEQREEVLRTYTDTFPARIPLEQNKEFKAIRNAVIQEAMKISQSQAVLRTTPLEPNREAAQEPVPEVLRELEQVPASAETPEPTQQETSEAPPRQDFGETNNPNNSQNTAPEPVPAVTLNTIAMTASVYLLTHLSRMIQKSAQEQEQTRKPRQDHVLQRQQDEKKQALGIRD